MENDDYESQQPEFQQPEFQQPQLPPTKRQRTDGGTGLNGYALASLNSALPALQQEKVVYHQGHRDQDCLDICKRIDETEGDYDSKQLSLLTVLYLLPQDLLIAYMRMQCDHTNLGLVVSRMCTMIPTLKD
jgi:hypothetical protein